MNRNDIIAIYVAYNDGQSGKRRPVLIIHYDQEGIEFYRLTSQYANKSKSIQERYYEIKDWKEVGLEKPSWIDIGKRIRLPLNKLDNVTKIGKLSVKDKNLLADFIEHYYL